MLYTCHELKLISSFSIRIHFMFPLFLALLRRALVDSPIISSEQEGLVYLIHIEKRSAAFAMASRYRCCHTFVIENSSKRNGYGLREPRRSTKQRAVISINTDKQLDDALGGILIGVFQFDRL